MRGLILVAALLVGGCSRTGTDTLTSAPLVVPRVAPAATHTATAKPKPKPTARPVAQPKATKKPTAVYYANCTAVRDAGKAPLYRGDPGYVPKLDRDGDGVACE